MTTEACSIQNCQNRCAACNAVRVTPGSAMACFSLKETPVKKEKSVVAK
jgi:hypothetical protein